MSTAKLAVHRESLLLPRLLATALFSLTPVLGVASGVLAGWAVLTVNGPVLGLTVTALVLVQVLVWLAKRIWAGRPIPAWFIAGAFVALGLDLIGWLVVTESWIIAAALLLMLSPFLARFASRFRRPPALASAQVPTKPIAFAFDDLA